MDDVENAIETDFNKYLIFVLIFLYSIYYSFIFSLFKTVQAE